jgi:hypothetical protein
MIDEGLIEKFTPSGQTYIDNSQLISSDSLVGLSSYPNGITIDNNGNAYALWGGSRIQKFSTTAKQGSNLSGSKSSDPLVATTTFTATCTNGSGQATDSKTVTVSPIPKIVTPGVRPHIDIGDGVIAWDKADYASCVLKIGTEATTTLSSQTGTITLNSQELLMDAVMTCTDSTKIPTKLVLTTLKSTCVPSQGTSIEMYAGINTTWTTSLSPATGTVISREWSGSYIATTTTYDAAYTSIFNKLYTTSGPKNIKVTTVGKREDGITSFTTVCSTSTIMKNPIYINTNQ